MRVERQDTSDTSVTLRLVADQQLLDDIKQQVVSRLSKNVRLQGFRAGKAPANLVEKSLDQAQLQQEFLEQAVNQLYSGAVDQERLRPVSQPQISITKFVPFSTLEVTAEVEAVGTITLPDYTKIKLAKPVVSISEAQIDDVITNLQSRVATKSEVTRAAKDGDELIIDFLGTDAKTKEPISGADGKDYALVLGSKSFIPGFEDNLIGLKAGVEKDFPLTFPKDYGSEALQNKKVSFKVTVQKVQKIELPKVDKAFAALIGPFKSVAELRADIRRELESQQTKESESQYENQLLETIAAKTSVAIPPALIDEEVERLEQQERQNTAYRGQTWQEHLDEEGLTDEEHKQKNRPGAELRVKAGLILGEVAEKEAIKVSGQEVDLRLQLLKGLYTDKAMLAELDKPESRRDITGRLLTEKTLDKLKSFAS